MITSRILVTTAILIAATTFTVGTGLVAAQDTGAEEFNRTFGGSDFEDVTSGTQTSDGGYVMVGDIDSHPSYGAWLLKTDSGGNIEFNETIVGPYEPRSVIQTSDGGYVIVGGSSDQFGGFLIKMNSRGEVVFNKTYGGQAFSANSVVQTKDGGYAVAGNAGSFDSRDVWLIKTDNNGNVEFNKTFGGSDSDSVDSILQTSTGGYAMAGRTESFDSKKQSAWLIKTNSSGYEEFNKTFDKTNSSSGESLIQTSDGGYALGGSTSPNLTEPSFSGLLIKTDDKGSVEFKKTFGESDFNGIESLIQTQDGGYSLALGNGELIKTDSGGDIEFSKHYNLTSPRSVIQTRDGGYTLIGFGYIPVSRLDLSSILTPTLMKVDENGNVKINRHYRKFDFDYSSSVEETSDGGYVMAGSAVTGDRKIGWLMKTDQNGYEEFNTTFGYGPVSSAIQTTDGGYFIVGSADLEGAWFAKVDENGRLEFHRILDETDVLESAVQTSDEGYAVVGKNRLIKLNENGTEEFNKTFDGFGKASSVVQTSDGGYAVAGSSTPSNVKKGAWLIKTDDEGDVEFTRTFGGSNNDIFNSVLQTSDGGYAMAGATASFGSGRYDGWLIKTDSNGTVEVNETYGGTDLDGMSSVVQTTDNGYGMAGTTASFGSGKGDVWLIKTDDDGNIGFEKTFGGSDVDRAKSVVQAKDGGYVIAGQTSSGVQGQHAWLIKTVGSDGGNKPPSASFSFDPSTPTVGETVVFNASESSDSDGNITEYIWNFGDGNVSSSKNVSNTYADNRTYTVSLTVVDDEGATDTVKRSIQVNKENKPPVANFSYTPSEPREGDEVEFDGSNSFDPDGTITKYEWTFSDGDRSTGERATRRYFADGVYKVKLTVTDDDGDKNTTSKDIEVEKVPRVTVKSEDVVVNGVGNTGNGTILVDANEGLHTGDVTVSVNGSVAEISSVREGGDVNSSNSSQLFEVTNQTASSVTIKYTNTVGTEPVNSFELAEIEFSLLSESDTKILLSTENFNYLNDSGENMQYTLVSEDEGRIFSTEFTEPLPVPGFAGPPQNIPVSEGGFNNSLVEDLDGDGDATDVGPTVSVFGEIIRGNDLGLTDQQARKFNWNSGSPSDRVTVADMVTLFGKQIRAN
jgi:PKD repeat protein